MLTLLYEWLGRTIKIDQTGDAGAIGRLVNVQQDYCSLYTENKQMVHFPFSLIKSIKANFTEISEEDPVMDECYPATFGELVNGLHNRMVKVENGKKSCSGVISAVQDGYVQIVLNMNEVMFYPLEQIKCISPVVATKAETQETNTETNAATNAETYTTSETDSHSNCASPEPLIDWEPPAEKKRKSRSSNPKPALFSVSSKKSKKRSRRNTRRE